VLVSSVTTGAASVTVGAAPMSVGVRSAETCAGCTEVVMESFWAETASAPSPACLSQATSVAAAAMKSAMSVFFVRIIK